MVGSAGSLVTAVQESVCVEVVRLAPLDGDVIDGKPEGAIALTENETLPYAPQLPAPKLAPHARTANTYDPFGRLMSVEADALPEREPEKTVAPVFWRSTRIP